MSERDDYPPGVPCWVETLQPSPTRAMAFYGQLFGWQFSGPRASAQDEPDYVVARKQGSDVAGICALPPRARTGWYTHIRVAEVEAAVSVAVRAGARLLDGPIEAAPAGRLAVLEDPTGATFCVWQAETRNGAQRINEASAWAMSALSTRDPPRARAFYGAAFGWRSEPFGPAALMRLPGYFGGTPQQPVPRDVVAVMMPAGDGAASCWLVDFWVDGIEARVAQVREGGGRVLMDVHEDAIFRHATVADPQGAIFTMSEKRVPDTDSADG